MLTLFDDEPIAATPVRPPLPKPTTPVRCEDAWYAEFALPPDWDTARSFTLDFHQTKVQVDYNPFWLNKPRAYTPVHLELRGPLASPTGYHSVMLPCHKIKDYATPEIFVRLWLEDQRAKNKKG